MKTEEKKSETKETWEEERKTFEQYGAKLIGTGEEKRFNRKTVIVQIGRKWHHFYGETYHICFKKAFRKIKKKKER